MYPQGASSTIGSLLRMVQEDQNQNIAGGLPSAQTSSPIRQVVQQPVTSPEAPGSSHVVAVRPEAAIQSGPQAQPGNVVAPVMPPPPVAPVAPPSSPVSRPAASPAPAAGPSTPAPSPSPLARLGTSIRPTQSVLGASTVSQPSASLKFNAPKATPKPSVQRSTPQPARVGTLIASIPNFLKGLINASYNIIPEKTFPTTIRKTVSSFLG